MPQPGGATPHRGASPRNRDERTAGARLRTSPSGRTPQWVLDDALEQRQQALLSPGARRRRARRAARAARRSARRWAKVPRSRSRAWRATPAVGVVVLLMLWFTPGLFQDYALPVLRPYFPGASAPPPGVEAARAPLGTPPAVADTGGYRFMDSPDPGQPMVAYDPCRPVHYVVRPDGAPPGGQRLVEEAVAEISAATGLRFVADGTTTEAPSAQRAPYQPDRYGRQWAPVLITWSDATEVPDLAGNVVGLGGSTPRQAPGRPFVYVTGQVTLDAPGLTEVLDRPDGAAHVRATIVHELAHVVGLTHVDDPAQLMHPGGGATVLAAGDRAGLAELGAGECVPQL
ncbi:peptidase [Kocuria rosea]|uniref:peptidase n=1 Tax=Kocuria rosea TaxID=1275 RepID=UPI000AE71276|nr:peptidase [Kocuria polaris]